MQCFVNYFLILHIFRSVDVLLVVAFKHVIPLQQVKNTNLYMTNLCLIILFFKVKQSLCVNE